MVKSAVGEVPPPGAGLNTVTFAVPVLAMSAGSTLAVSCVPLMNVVDRSEPFQRTVAPLTKLDPFTVIVKPGLAAPMDDGERPLIRGAPLGAPVTLNIDAGE